MFLGLMALIALVQAGACATTAGAACDRDCRLAEVRNVAMADALPAKVRATENGAVVKQLWTQTAANLTIHGAYAGDRGDEGVLVGSGTGADGKPAVFGLRVKVIGGKPTEAELIVTHQGEAGLFPPTLPKPRDPLFDDLVAPAQRTGATRMVAAANAYFDGIEKHNGKDVPASDTCNRIENGVQTTRTGQFVGGGCNALEAFAYIPEVRERRFPVVDEERGVVLAAVAFWIPGGDYKRMIDGKEMLRHYDPRSLLLFEAFKIVDGKIARIEATMRNVPLGASMGWSR